MRPTLARVTLIIFLSGYCSLVYQVGWLRLLRLVFGSSTASTAVVLAIFMGGLGLGGWFFGRRAERTDNPLALYAWLEIGIALAAALSPLLIDLTRQIYIAAGGVGTLGMSGATLLRMAAATLVLGVPTTLMGGTLPAVAQAIERERDQGRRRVAVLYGVNTFGAVAGAFLATFLLLELLGTRQAIWLACAVNLLIAMVVRSMARHPAATEPPPTTASADADDGEAVPATPSALERSRLAAPAVLVTAGLVGFIFFLMELVWYRLLAPILGGSSYTFGLILAMALFGIATGGALYSLGSERRRPTLQALSWTCLLEALCLGVPYALGDHLAFLAIVLRPLDAMGFPGLVGAWTVIAAIVVLPAAIVSGYQFPLLVGLLGSGRNHVGSQVGLAYAWNTWGAILGSMLGGFALMPMLTAPRLWRWSLLLLVVLGFCLAVIAWQRQHRPVKLAAATVAGLLIASLCLAEGPTAFWRHAPIGAGRVEASFEDPNQLRDYQHQRRRGLLVEAEGLESSVALVRFNDIALLVNGKSDGSALGDSPTTVMSGLVGGWLHPAPKTALVIGFGTGATAGWLAQIPTIERVDVVELEPAVGRFAEYFASINFDALNDPKVHMIYGDGRETVLTGDRSYDLVMSEPSNPYRAGVADLFSRDFYLALEQRMAPGGIFMQWLQGYEIDAELLRLAYSTLSSVFPQVESWQIHITDMLLVATREPIVHDYDRLREKSRQEPFKSALANVWRVEGIDGLYSGFLGNPDLARTIADATGGDVSTDDRPLIEFGFARNVGRKGLFDTRQLRALSSKLGTAMPAEARGEPPTAQGIQEARNIRSATGTFVEYPPSLSKAALDRQAARAKYLSGEFVDAARHWANQGEDLVEARHPLDRLMKAQVLVETEDPRAREEIDAIAEAFPVEATYFEARLAIRNGEIDRATELLSEAFGLMRENPWVLPRIAEFALETVIPTVKDASPEAGLRLFEALAEPFAVFHLNGRRLSLRASLSQSLDLAGHCAEAFADFEPHVPWLEKFLRDRLECYLTAGHPLAGRAEAELEEFLEAAPPTNLGRGIELPVDDPSKETELPDESPAPEIDRRSVQD